MDGKTSVECRYFISSCLLKAQEAVRLNGAHWGIDNSLHWVLDVLWGEDASRARDRIAAHNLGLLGLA